VSPLCTFASSRVRLDAKVSCLLLGQLERIQERIGIGRRRAGFILRRCDGVQSSLALDEEETPLARLNIAGRKALRLKKIVIGLSFVTRATLSYPDRMSIGIGSIAKQIRTRETMTSVQLQFVTTNQECQKTDPQTFLIGNSFGSCAFITRDNNFEGRVADLRPHVCRFAPIGLPIYAHPTRADH
jgi:hypothetical protein